MALFDWIAIALLVVSMLFGLVRGLVFEVISLAGWVAALRTKAGSKAWGRSAVKIAEITVVPTALPR